MRRIVLALLAMTFLAPLVRAQTQPATGPATQPAIDPERAKIRLPWLSVHYTARGYQITMTVNDKEYGNWSDATGEDTKLTPFVAGKNKLVVDIVRKDNAAAKDSCEFTLLASPRQELRDDDEPVELSDVTVDEAVGQIKLTVDFANTQPRAFELQQIVWTDAEKKNRSWEYTADGDMIADEYAHEKETVWRSAGKLARTISHENGKVVDAVAYKPDGSVGAQVKGGEGTEADYDDDGRPTYEIPIHGGLQHGVMKTFHGGKPVTEMTYDQGVATGPVKRYDAKGVLRVTGQCKDDVCTGTWQRLGDDGKVLAECEYKDGELVKGEDLASIELH